MSPTDESAAGTAVRSAAFLRVAAQRIIRNIQFLASRFLLVTLVLAGALCGVLAVLFHRYVELARSFLIGPALEQDGVMRVVLILAVPAVVFALLAWLIRRFAPHAVGANLARVRRAYNVDPKILGPKTIGATFAATPLSLGAGAPLGPEGPIVVVASGTSVVLARLLRLPAKVVRAMVPIGVASGISAIFNTPITGVVFALEEVLGVSERGILGGVLVGSVAAAVVERLLLGGRPLLAAPFSTWHDPRELIGFALVGLVAGLTSGVAIRVAHRLRRRWSEVMPSMIWRAALAGLSIGGAGLIAPEILGVGYESISFWLHGGSSSTTTAVAFTVKLIAFVIAISGGVIGGTFAPSLFLGTALGAALGHAAHDLFPSIPIDPKAYAILGMGSFFAGLMRSPIAAVLIVVELTRDYELIVPLMLGVTLAVAVSRRISRLSIVEQQMVDEGYVEEREARDPLAQVRVASAMTTDVLTISRDTTFAEAARRIGDRRFAFYPVVGDEKRLDGIISRQTIDDATRSGRERERVDEAVEEPKLLATADTLLLDVVQQMKLRGVDRCPVVDAHKTRRVVGFLSPSDVLRARMRQAAVANDDSFDIFQS
jgi:CIC family chloride channel protein